MNPRTYSIRPLPRTALFLVATLLSSVTWGRVPGSSPALHAAGSQRQAAPETTTLWADMTGGAGTKTASFVRETPDGGWLYDGEVKAYGSVGRDYWVFKVDSSGAPVWATLYGTGQDDGGASHPTPDGGTIVAGWTSTGTGFSTSWLMKLDASGAISWQRNIAPAVPIGQNALGVTKILPDGYLLTGLGIDFTVGGIATLLVKTDLSGNILWQKSYTAGDAGLQAPSVVRLEDGSLMLGGMLMSTGENTDLCVLKLTATGEVIWAKTYGGPQQEFGGTGLLVTPDGGFLLQGQTKSWGPGGPPDDAGDIWLVKLDASGNIQWQFAYGGPGEDTGMAMPEISGGYFIGATTTSFGAGKEDLWAVKLDGSGQIVWQKTYGGPEDDYGAVLFDPAGSGYLLSATTLSFGAGGRDEWLAKLDASGDFVWQKTYGTSIDEEGAGYRQPSGAIFLQGSSKLPSPPTPTVQDAWFIHANDIGDLGTPCPFIHEGLGVAGTATGVAMASSASPVNLSVTVADGTLVSSQGSLAANTITLPLTDLCSGAPPSLSASASADKTSGVAPLSVSFTGSASGGTGPYTFSWNFGDGSTASTEQNPSHTFTVVGDFTVTLTVFDSASGTATDGHLVIRATATGRRVTLTWSAPAPGGTNPPQDLQVAVAGIMPRSESVLAEVEPNGCPIEVGGGDALQVLAPGDTVNGSVEDSDTGSCLYDDGDFFEDFFGLDIPRAGTYTLALDYSGSSDLDLYLMELPGLTYLNPICGEERCGVTCADPETFQVNLVPGTYLLGVNLASVNTCAPVAPATYTLSISGGSDPALQGYDVYRAPTDSDPSYTKLNGTLLPLTPTQYVDASAPDGTLFYRVKAVYDQGTSGWSNTATAGGSSCTVSCTATVPAAGVAGQPVNFTSTATPSNCTGTPTFAWTFGDGGISTLQNPGHTYAGAGTFSWSLTASIEGQTCSKGGSITVAGGQATSSDVPWAWGYNSAGQLGDGTQTSSPIPIQVATPPGVVAMEGGRQHTVAVRDDGTVWAWGYNFDGELGNGTEADSIVPVQALGLTGATAVAAGSNHSLALKGDGTVWAWGYNFHGQLGDGTSEDRSVPFQVTGISGTVAIAAGEAHSYALKGDGTVWAWGYNYYGQLGNGTSGTGTNSGVPVQVTGLTGVTAIAAGHNHGLALRSDGTLWGWGHNYNGQLGDGTTTIRPEPVPVSGLTGVTKIAAGYAGSLAIRLDRTLWAWGWNGASNENHTPEQVQALADVRGIAGGYLFALAFRGDGTLWAWGRNNYGRLGDGTTEWRDDPVAVLNIRNVRFVAAGDDHSLAVTSVPELPGDCNGDGSVSIGEVQKAINMFLGIEPAGCGADCSGDGSISIGEVQKVINAFLGLTASC